MNKNTKIGDVADHLGVTLQTVRNWLKIGDVYFSHSATRTTGKRFTTSDITQFEAIKELRAGGLNIDEIASRLSPAPQLVEDVGDTSPEPPTTPQDATSAIQTLELMQYVNELLEQQREAFQPTIDAKNELIRELRNDKNRLQDELNRLRLPWWQRLIK